MLCDGLRASSFLALCVSVSSLTVCFCGMLMDGWWLDTENNELGLFSTISCKDDICTKGGSSTAGWIVFAQVAGIIEIAMIIASILSQVFMMIFNHKHSCYVALGFLGVGCFFSLMQIFVVVDNYRSFTGAYMQLEIVPKNVVVYQTLNIGLCAIAGIMCVPAGIAMVYWLIQLTRETAVKKPGIV